MKTHPVLNALRLTALAGAVTVAVASAGVANATLISQDFVSGVEGGTVTFDDNLGSNQLRITFDNTSTMWNGTISGLVFNVSADINSASVTSFVDGNNVAITGWTFGTNVNNETTPNNTVFEIGFETSNGINDGIYNSGVATNFSNVFPDVATLIITISDPNPWALASIGSDSILRMQRTGADGEGSLKIVTSTSSTGGQTSGSTGGQTSGSTGGQSNGSIPEPGMVGLLGIGLLGQALILRQRRRRQQQQ